MNQVPINHFDRSKPFYPLVMHYLAQLIGVKELALRGIVGSRSPEELVDRIPALSAVPAASEPIATEVRQGLRKLSGPLELRSEYQNNHITINIDDIARDVVANHSYLLASTMRSAGALLILAHELSKDAPWHDTGPLWEFLRHSRNAAAHGGTFNLLHGEPRRPAYWGSFMITAKLQGTSLFKDAAGTGLLSPGDPIRLLWDIEQAYPQMRA
jgi:hypothetical protein